MGTLNVTKSASGTLGRLVTLGGERPGALVPDRILWEAAQLDYDEYVEAAAELVGRGLVENSLRGFLSLRAIPKGMKKE